MARRDRRRRGENWPNQFEVEPLSVYRQKEAQRTADLIKSAYAQKGLPPIPTHGAASPLVPKWQQRAAFGRPKAATELPKPGQQFNYAGQLRDPRFRIPGMDQGGFGGGRTQFPSQPAPEQPGMLQRLGGLGLSALEASSKYVGTPAAGLVALHGDRKPIIDPKTGQTLGYYREKPIASDPAGFLTKFGGGALGTLAGLTSGNPGGLGALVRGGADFLQNPLDKYKEAQQAGEEYYANPNMSKFERVVGSASNDPANMIAPGALSGAAKFIPAGIKGIRGAPLAGRFIGGLLDAPVVPTTAGIVGAGAAAQWGEQVPGFNKIPEGLQPIVGGLAAGVGAGYAPRVPQAVRSASARAKGWRPADVLAGETPLMAATNMPDVPKRKPFMAKDREALGAEAPPPGEPESFHRPAVTEKDAQNRLLLNQLPDLDARALPIARRIVEGGGMQFGIEKTPEKWVAESDGLLSEAEIMDAARWYRDLHANFEARYGAQDAPAMVDAYLTSQVNESVEAGLTNVHRAEDILKGRISLNAKGEPNVTGSSGHNMVSIMNALERIPSLHGISVKISDFIDSQRGKTTRTVVGDDPRGGRPFVADVWMGRDAGFIDEVVAQRIKELTGQDVTDDMKDFLYDIKPDGKKDGGTFAPNDYQYEWVSRWGNRLTDYLNDVGWHGKTDWTPAEIQAIGWFKARKWQGAKGGSIEDVFDYNSRRVAMDIAPGVGTPFEKAYGPEWSQLPPEKKQAITTEFYKWLVPQIAEMTGARILRVQEGPGEWLQEPVWSVTIDALGSPETTQDFADAMAYMGYQTAVVSARPLISGNQMALDLSFSGVEPQAFWNALREADPELFSGGFGPGPGGKGIRAYDTVGAWGQGKGGSMTPQMEARMGAAIKAASDKVKVDTAWYDFKAEAAWTVNDWNGVPDGSGHLSGIRQRGRSDLPGRLDGLAPLRDGKLDDLFAQHAGTTDRRLSGGGAPAGPPANPRRGLRQRAGDLAARALSGDEAPAAGVTTRMKPGDLAEHGTYAEPFEGMPDYGRDREPIPALFGGNLNGGVGPYYTGTEDDVSRFFHGNTSEGSRVFKATPTRPLKFLATEARVLPAEQKRIRGAVSRIFGEDVAAKWDVWAQDYYDRDAYARELIYNLPDFFKRSKSGWNGDRPDRLVYDIFKKAGWDGLDAERPRMANDRLHGIQVFDPNDMEPEWFRRAREGEVGPTRKTPPDPNEAFRLKLRESIAELNETINFFEEGGAPSLLASLKERLGKVTEQMALLGEEPRAPGVVADTGPVDPRAAELMGLNRPRGGPREGTLPNQSVIDDLENRLEKAQSFDPDSTEARSLERQLEEERGRSVTALPEPEPGAIPEPAPLPDTGPSAALKAIQEEIATVQEELDYFEKNRIGGKAERDMIARLRSQLARATQMLADEQGTAVGVAPRRQRMAGGGVNDKDYAQMPADEIAQVLGRSEEEVNRLWEMMRAQRDGELPREVQKRFDEVKRALRKEYAERFGGNPVRTYELGTRAENYRGIDAAAKARGLDPTTETANIGGAYRKAGDPYDGEIIDRAPHERVEGYESDRPTASEAAARQAEDVAAGDMPAPRIEKRERSYGELTDERKRVQTAIDRIEAKRTAENRDQMDKRVAPLEKELAGIEAELRAQETGPEAGEAGGIAGRQSIGRGLLDAYAPFRSPAGIAARFGAGYGAARLEGEDNETALERAIMAAAPGVAGRAGVRAGARAAENVSRAWDAPEPVKPRWGSSKTPEELRKRAEQRKVNIENLAKARQAPRKAKPPSPKVEADLDAALEEMGIPPPEAASDPRPYGNRLRPGGGTPRTSARPREEVIAEQLDKLEAERAQGPGPEGVGPIPQSVQEARFARERIERERGAIEKQQGAEGRSTPGRVAPAATFPEGPESAATTPLGGDFEPTPLEGAGPVDVANPLTPRTPEEQARVSKDLAARAAQRQREVDLEAEPLRQTELRVTEARRRVEKERADALALATQPAEGIAGAPTDIENKVEYASPEEALAKMKPDDPRREFLEKWKDQFNEEAHKKDAREGKTSGNWVNKVFVEFPAAASRVMFSLATSGDFGSGSIQTHMMVFTDPKEWSRSMKRSFQAIASPEFREGQRKFNQDRIEAAVPEAMRGEIYETVVKGRITTNPDGTTKTGPRLAISTTAGEMSGDFGSPLLEKGKYNPVRPYLQAFRRQFETQTEHLRVHAFAEMLEMARQLNIKEGKGDILFPHQVDGAINKANHLTGATSGKMNPVLGIAFGAPRFLLSQFAVLQDLFSPGTSGTYARRKVIQSFGTVLTATVAVNLVQSKGKDWFGPGLGGPDDIKDSDDFKELVTHPNFGRIRVSIPKLGESDISLFGPLDPMARAFFKEMANLDNIRTGDESVRVGTATAGFLENKASAFPRTILNLAVGEDRFSGREMDSWQDVLAVEAPRVAPIFTQSMEEALSGEGSWTNMLIGYTGMKSSPLSPTEKVDAVMAGLPDKYWVVDAENQEFRPPENIWELSAKERSEIRTEYPAVARYLEKLEDNPDKPFLQQVATDFAANQKKMDTDLENGDLNTDDWRERFVANQRQLRDLRDAKDPFEERELTTQRATDIDNYFGIYDMPEVLDEDGKLDYSLVEQQVRAFRARVGENRWADIEETLGWNESATVRQYHEDMRNYGDFMSTNPKYEGVPPERTRRADSIAGKVRSVQASIPGTPSKYILGLWRDEGSITQQEYDDTIIAMGRKYTEEYEDWKETPEGTAALDWFQPVNRKQDFVIPEGTTFPEGGGSSGSIYGDSGSERRGRRDRRGRRSRRTRRERPESLAS